MLPDTYVINDETKLSCRWRIISIIAVFVLENIDKSDMH